MWPRGDWGCPSTAHCTPHTGPGNDKAGHLVGYHKTWLPPLHCCLLGLPSAPLSTLNAPAGCWSGGGGTRRSWPLRSVRRRRLLATPPPAACCSSPRRTVRPSTTATPMVRWDGVRWLGVGERMWVVEVQACKTGTRLETGCMHFVHYGWSWPARTQPQAPAELTPCCTQACQHLCT